MAAYRADIEIGVKGARNLEQLRSSINLTARAVDSLNDVVSARGSLVQNIQNYTNNLNRAARSLQLVGAGTEAETKAVREYVRALGEANAARARQNSLVAQELANQRRVTPGNAGYGQQGPALPPAVIRAQQVQQSWNRFFQETAELAQDLRSTAKAEALNTRTSWTVFFQQAADVAKDLQTTAAQRTSAVKDSWVKFLSDAAQVGQDLTARAANIRASEGAASQAARERLSQTPAAGLSGVTRRPIAGAAYAEPAGPGGAGVTRASAVAAEASLRRTLELQLKAAAAAGSWATALQTGSRWLNEDLDVTAALLRANEGLLSSTNAQIAARKQLVKVKQFEAEQSKRAKRTEQLNESIALGVGFPLLFGGGLGSVAGSFAGSFAGKGFGGQIIGGALGQLAEDFVRSAAKVTTSTESIAEALGLAGTKSEDYLKALQKAGKETEAYSIATERLATVVGRDGVKAFKDLEEAGKTFNKAFAEISTSILALAAQLISGAAKSISAAVEETALFRRATVSQDPQIQQLIQQRQSVGAGFQSFITAGKSDEDLINRILDRQRELDKIEDKKLEKAAKNNTLAEEELRINRLTQEEKQAQITLAQLGNDLTDIRVFLAKQELIEAKFRVEAEQELLKGTSDVNAQLNRRLALAQLNQQREEAIAASAAKAAKELERQRKELERMAKLRREQLSDAQRGFVLAELDLGVAATDDEKARAQAVFDRRRAERMFEYTELLQKALSEEERIALVSKQETEIFTANLLLNKELFDIDLKRAKLLNEQGPAAALQEEINLLAAKIQGKEREYEITKQIDDLVRQGEDPAQAAGLVMTLKDLNAQNDAIEAQKQLWADIYTTVAGQIQNAITGLIDGTAEWGDLLSNILGSLGSLFLNAAFSGLGSALKLPGFAEGGFVTKPTTAVVGEGGEPEYVIPASKMRTAMGRYSAGARGSSVIPGSGEQAVAGGGGGVATMEPIDVRYSVERINNVDYVTADQFQRGLAQAAQQGAIQGERRAMRSLKNSSATRRGVGL